MLTWFHLCRQLLKLWLHIECFFVKFQQVFHLCLFVSGDNVICEQNSEIDKHNTVEH